MWDAFAVRPSAQRRAVAPAIALAVGLLLGAANLYLVARWSTRGRWYGANELIQQTAWLVTGYLATRVRPTDRIGPLMLAFGLILASDSAVGLGLPADRGALAVVSTVS